MMNRLKGQRGIFAGFAALGIGERSFGDKNLVWSELARRDRLVIFNALLGIYQNRDGFFRDRVVVGPLCQDVSAESIR